MGGDDVSKKKRKLKKRLKANKDYLKDSQKKDLHHLCYQRAKWRGGAVGELREFHYCKMYIPKNTLHRMIHIAVDSVPVPKSINAKEALKQLIMLERQGAIRPNDSLDKRLRLLAALFDCVEQPTADAFRAQLEIVRNFNKKPSA